MALEIPTSTASKEQLKFRRAGGYHKHHNQELVAAMVDDISTASNKLPIAAETVSFTAGAAGTTGTVTLDKAPVYNVDGGKIGRKGDTSFAWITGTILIAGQEKDYDDSLTDTDVIALLTVNGDWILDYLTGRLFYRKATAGTSDTCNYSTRQINVEVTAAGVGTDVNIKQIGGVAPVADDAAFTPATSTGIVAFGFADDTAPDAVNEGDVGALRMGLDRVLYVQGQSVHDAAIAGNPIQMGAYAAGSKPTAVTAGDMVRLYADLFGRLHVYDEGGGGVSGGGFGTYTFSPTNSFGDGTSAYAAATQFTVSGHTFTPEAVGLVKIDRFNAAGAYQDTMTPSQNTITCSTTAGVTTYTITAATFTAGDLFMVYQGGPERTVTKTTDSQRTEEISPLNQQAVPESWADTTNVGAGPTYYPSADGKEMTGIKSISFTGKLIDGDAEANTFTFEGTNDEDATSTNRDWITLYGYRTDTDTYVNSVGITTATTLTFAYDLDNCNYKYVSAKFIGGASATNTVILKARTVAI